MRAYSFHNCSASHLLFTLQQGDTRPAGVSYVAHHISMRSQYAETLFFRTLLPDLRPTISKLGSDKVYRLNYRKAYSRFLPFLTRPLRPVKGEIYFACIRHSDVTYIDFSSNRAAACSSMCKRFSSAQNTDHPGTALRGKCNVEK